MPELEEREAALFGQYTWSGWAALPYEERVDGVAHYRLHHYIELHRRDALDRHTSKGPRRK